MKSVLIGSLGSFGVAERSIFSSLFLLSFKAKVDRFTLEEVNGLLILAAGDTTRFSLENKFGVERSTFDRVSFDEGFSEPKLFA